MPPHTQMSLEETINAKDSHRFEGKFGVWKVELGCIQTPSAFPQTWRGGGHCSHTVSLRTLFA